jgi:hypothetical protein
VVVTPADFKSSLAKTVPPAGLAPPVAALWWAAKGEWDKAHTIIMGEQGADAAWVHAYLHRVEGDLPNARYWYGVARQPAATAALDAEWSAIVAALLT